MNRVVWLNAHGNCFPFRYGFCPSERAFRHAVKKLNVVNHVEYPKGEAATMHFEAKDGDVIALVIVAEGDLTHSPLAIFALLVHEASHVFDLLCTAMKENAPSEEFKAYTLQMFSSQLIATYIRTRRPKLVNLLVIP